MTCHRNTYMTQHRNTYMTQHRNIHMTQHKAINNASRYCCEKLPEKIAAEAHQILLSKPSREKTWDNSWQNQSSQDSRWNYIRTDQKKNYNKYFNTIQAPATGAIKLSALQISKNGLHCDKLHQGRSVIHLLIWHLFQMQSAIASTQRPLTSGA